MYGVGALGTFTYGERRARASGRFISGNVGSRIVLNVTRKQHKDFLEAYAAEQEALRLESERRIREELIAQQVAAVEESFRNSFETEASERRDLERERSAKEAARKAAIIKQEKAEARRVAAEFDKAFEDFDAFDNERYLADLQRALNRIK